jgi:hypothetical protein
MHLSDKGLFDSANRLVPCTTEADVFHALGLEYKEPQDRFLCPLVKWWQRRKAVATTAPTTASPTCTTGADGDVGDDAVSDDIDCAGDAAPQGFDCSPENSDYGSD